MINGVRHKYEYYTVIIRFPVDNNTDSSTRRQRKYGLEGIFQTAAGNRPKTRNSTFGDGAAGPSTCAVSVGPGGRLS